MLSQQDVLVISDPKALQYIFHTSGYRYPKSPEEDRFTGIMLGPGVGTVAGTIYSTQVLLILMRRTSGEIHQRQRKILGPAFATSQLRQFLVVFQSAGSKVRTDFQHLHYRNPDDWSSNQLVEKMKDSTQTGKVLDVYEWITKISLDVIGKSKVAFSFNGGANYTVSSFI